MSQATPQDITNVELARMIKEGFDNTASKEDLARVEGRMTSVEGKITSIEAKMATKEDLKNEIGKLRSDMIDYIISKADANKVARLEPFPQSF
ncbi:MAG: hypothetical protein AAB400_04280 [Patescibacteria group bacterium]